MTNRFVLFLFFYCFIVITACEKDEEPIIEDPGTCLVLMDGDFVEMELDEMPFFLDGGQDTFFLRLLREVHYPAYARENGIQGLCRVQYEITQGGTVENIEILEDPGGGIGEATVAGLQTVTDGMPFSPGILNGIPVTVRKELRMRFKLQ
jgi:protein TonB